MREHHRKARLNGKAVCWDCEDPWPCEVARLRAEVEHLRERLAASGSPNPEEQ